MKRQKLTPEVEALYLAPLAPEEFDRRLRASLAELEGPELENLGDLIRWFKRRYPTAGERLAYGRRAYARWVRASERPVPAQSTEGKTFGHRGSRRNDRPGAWTVTSPRRAS